MSDEAAKAAEASRQLREQMSKMPLAIQILNVDVVNVLREGYTRRQRLAIQTQRLAPGEIGASETTAILPPSILLPPLL